MDTEDIDSVERFVADLRALHRAHRSEGYRVVGRRTGLSHGAVHRALTSQTLPSEYVLTPMIQYWDPQALDQWIERRTRLDRSTTKKHPRSTSASTSSEIHAVTKARMGRAHVTAIVLAFTFGAALTLGLTPIHSGGIDVWDFCGHTYGPEAGSPPAEGTEDGGLWICRLKDGELVPADMSLACREQHPAWSPAGRAFVIHQSSGLTTWQCYTTQISFTPLG